MDLSTRALLDYDEAKIHLGLDADDDNHRELVITLVNQVSAAIEKRTGKKYRQSTYTDIIDGTGRAVCWTKRTPVTAVTTISFYDGEDWDDVTESPYTYTINFDGDSGKIYFDERGGTFPKGSMNIKLEYTAGYDGVSAVPYDVKMAAGILLLRYFTLHNQSLAGVKSQSIEGGSAAYDLDKWPDDVTDLLGIGKKICL
jgi:hypothetical protein